MSGLSRAKRTKLAKVFGLFSSPYDGEIVAAVHAASQILQSDGLTWAQLLEPAVERKLPELGTWRQTTARCLEQAGSLRPWEIGFLQDLPGFRRLSVKQRYILNEIADRVLGADR